MGTEQARLEIVDPGLDAIPTTTIVPLARNGVATEEFLQAAVAEALEISRPGTQLLSPAVANSEADVFRAVGFSERSTLQILLRNSDATTTTRLIGRRRMPRAARPVGQSAVKIRLRRGRKTHVDRCLALDLAAFGPDQAMRRTSFEAALTATPQTRFRIALADNAVVAYAVTGRSAGRGYLQRLAVHPDFASQGIGTRLVEDAIEWCDRRRVRRMVVNTQHDNTRALDLYRRLGFVTSPMSLYVLEYEKPSSTVFDAEAVLDGESGFDADRGASGEMQQ